MYGVGSGVYSGNTTGFINMVERTMGGVVTVENQRSKKDVSSGSIGNSYKYVC